MSNIRKNNWGTLESYRSTAFTVAGLIFLGLCVLQAFNVAQGTWNHLLLAQGSIGVAWTAIFLGTLGFHPSLSNESQWILRGGTLFALIGLITSVTLAVAMFGLYFGLFGGEYSDYMAYIAPAYLVSIPLGCGLYSAAILRSSIYSKIMGILIFLPALAFLFNYGTSMILGFHTLAKLLGVVTVLMLVSFSLAYLIRSGNSLLTEP